jgi:molecular chaperone HscA
MALLQISEPGQSPDPHQRRLAVGIDLGTTHSLVAAVRHGVPECLPDEAGRVLLPSVVRYLDAGRREIGFAARDAQATDPANTVASAKRWMARPLADIQDADRLPYEFVAQPGMVAVRTRQGDKTPVEVAADILATLRYRAEDTLGDDLFGAVITVPAYFDDAQRQATKDAAQLAGLNVLRLISEPTAAAVAYGLDQGSEGLFAVYDLGGGTFDISLLRLHRGVFEVVATGGDAALGGDDIDDALARWALMQAGVQAGIEAGLQAASATDKRAALVAARAAKEALSSSDAALFACTVAGQTLQLSITRAQLEAVARPLVDRTLVAVRRVLRDARVAREDVQGVVMVGGSTRMPLVRTAVAEAFGREVLTNVNPDEVVALGAAIQAHALAGHAAGSDLLLLDVIALSLGLETLGGLVERIVERNTTLPVSKAQDFTTHQDGQTAMALHVVQGEREGVSQCRSLARFELRGIPPMAAGAARIRVTFQVDADGLLSVSARELSSGVEASVVVKPSHGLSDTQIADMLRESFAHAEDDMALRQLTEARVEAQRMVLATRSALAVDAALISTDDVQALESLLLACEQAAHTADVQAIEDATHRLAEGSEAFAGARMNRSIRQALAGRRVEDV